MNLMILNYLKLIAIISCLVFLYQESIMHVVEICLNDDDYSHGLLLPFAIAYIYWIQKDVIIDYFSREKSEKISLIGLLLFLTGIGIYFVGVVSHLMFVYWVSFFFVIPGIFILLFGFTGSSVLISPFMLLYMARALPDIVIIKLFWPMQVYAAQVSHDVLRLLDVPVYIYGNIIEIPHMRLLVEEACSGMRSVMSLLTVAFLIPFLFSLNWASKIGLVVLALALAIGLNIVRVAMTGVLAHFYDPSAAEGFFHEFSGLVVFVIGLFILYSLVFTLEKWSLRSKKKELV